MFEDMFSRFDIIIIIIITTTTIIIIIIIICLEYTNVQTDKRTDGLKVARQKFWQWRIHEIAKGGRESAHPADKTKHRAEFCCLLITITRFDNAQTVMSLNPDCNPRKAFTFQPHHWIVVNPHWRFYTTRRYKTSSSAVARRPLDASCLSVAASLRQ